MMNILYAVLVLGVMGAIFGGLLAFAGEDLRTSSRTRG